MNIRQLLKRPGGLGWSPLIYLIYLVFLFFQPAIVHANWKVWCLTTAAVLAGAALYVAATLYKGRLAYWALAGLLALGYGMSPWNGGASSFIIYAAALFGFVLSPRVAFLALAGVVAGVGLESWALQLMPWYWVPTIVVTAIAGIANVYVAKERQSNAKLLRAQEEVEHLAKVAERERIARDLHDVLGHTLSVIVLKSELASKLVDRDPERARTEMSDVERIAREALGEVRHAIRGYRAGSLVEEFARARATLETAGIKAECELPPAGIVPGELSAPEETVLALILREAVTNVVRHSSARVCRLRLANVAGQYRLDIEDDGVGAIRQEGNGLRGMRERVEALSGSMQVLSSRGTQLSVSIPVTRRQETLA